MIRLHRAEGTFLGGGITDVGMRGSTGEDQTAVVLPHQVGSGQRRLFLCTPEEMIKLEPVRPHLVPIKHIRRCV